MFCINQFEIMIIIKTPLRVSFLGGGTDFPKFINNNNFGCVISTTIDKFIYISIKKHGELFNEKIRLNYSNAETTNNVPKIKNDIIRETLKFLKIKERIYISTVSDIPSNSGLGSSSSFCVGLLKGLYKFIGKKVTPLKIARDAFHIEKNLLGKNVGYQDHYIAALGGLNFIKFYKNKIVNKKITDTKTINILNNSYLCFATNKYRKAESILSDQNRNFKINELNLKNIKKLTLEGNIFLSKKKYNDFFYNINKSWEQKKLLSKKISNKSIDKAYDLCIKNNALGGKISGAGGGGFLSIFAKKKHHKNIISAMKNIGYKHIVIKLESCGSKVIEF